MITKNFTVNPVLNAFIPPLTEGVKQGLEESLKKEGCRDPVVVWKETGYLIDGHHRVEICNRLNIPYRVQELSHKDELDAKIWMLKNQFRRRNLPDFIKGELALELEKLESQKARKRQACGRGGSLLLQHVAEGSGLDEKGTTRDRIGKMVGLSGEQIRRIKKIKEKAIPEDIDALRKGTKQVGSVFRLIQYNEKKEEAKRKLESLETVQLKEFQGVYDVVVIDPPWEIGESFEPSNEAGYLPLQYPTMTLDEIRSLEIPCADDCHVFMWTTQKFLYEAKNILDNWGLKYVCTFTWVKNGGAQPLGLPQYNSEFFIYARQGSPKFLDTKNFFTVLNAKRRGHSVKPEEFYELLRRVTAGRRLDMFNRREIEGFDYWGNEAAG